MPLINRRELAVERLIEQIILLEPWTARLIRVMAPGWRPTWRAG